MFSSVPSAFRILASADSPGKLYLLFFPLGSTIPENTGILSEILNLNSITKVKSAGKSVLTKTTEKSCKIQVATLESGLLAPISARANKTRTLKNTFSTKAHVSPGEKTKFQSWKK